MSDITQDVIVLNDFGFEERRRTTSKGTSSRFTVTIKSEPLVHVFDERQLGKGPAEAIREVLWKGIRGIEEFAALATVKRRERARRALAAGTGSAVRRYDGGRTGRKEPGQTVRVFNDSGRLADGLEVRENVTEKSWTVNVTKNRLTPIDFGTQAQLLAMVERLQRLVPELGDPRALLKHSTVTKAIDAAISNLIIKALERGTALRSQRRGALLRLVGGSVGARIAALGEVTFP